MGMTSVMSGEDGSSGAGHRCTALVGVCSCAHVLAAALGCACTALRLLRAPAAVAPRCQLLLLCAYRDLATASSG